LPDCSDIYRRARQQAFHWKGLDDFRLEDFERDTLDEDVWVGVEFGRILGFVGVFTPASFIHHLYVAPEAQGRGVGGRLLELASERLESPLELKCLLRNRRAREFYRQRGWQEVGRGEAELGEYALFRRV
jgi:GNAT superfamily N-acetyltransferase